MPERNDPTSTPGPVRTAEALARLAELLAETCPPPSPEPVDYQLPWGNDAAAHPPDYWHRIYLDRLQASESQRRPELPTDGPLVSVIVPVYRPSHWYFVECARSVAAQTYTNWELCLCDDASGDPELTRLIGDLAAKEPRIKATAFKKNGGISEATNAALELATGELVALLDHDDALEPDALAEVVAAVLEHEDADVIYTDDDKIDAFDRPFQPQFKPDWAPDLLLSYPYLGHLTVIRRSLLEEIGGFRSEFDGSQDFDVMLRATERARRVVHVPKVLYHWRVVSGSAAGDAEAKPWAYAASRRAVEDALRRRGIDGRVENGPFLGSYSVRRHVDSTPSIAVIVPFRDQAALTARCVEHLDATAGHLISELVLVDNGSAEAETRALRKQLGRRRSTRILDYPGPFNWSVINNTAAASCDSDLLLFLNNDVFAEERGWLEAMVEHAVRTDIGAVGARLVYPNGRLQHTGIVLGLGGIAGHVLAGLPVDTIGYGGWDRIVREYSAVTAACMLVRRSVFEEVGGFDETLAIAFNDIDFCLRLRAAGYRVVSTPHAQLVHAESVSRGFSGYSTDYRAFLRRWGWVLRREDPYFNPNLSRLVTWCALRLPGEDDQWADLVGLLADDPRDLQDQPEPAETIAAAFT